MKNQEDNTTKAMYQLVETINAKGDTSELNKIAEQSENNSSSSDPDEASK